MSKIESPRAGLWALCLALSLLAGCKVGPNYKRPAAPAPPAYRDAAPDPSRPPEASLADLKWFDLFQDERLQELLRTALAQNYDLRVASARVLEARALYGVTRADLFPTVAGQASVAQSRISQSGSVQLPPGTDRNFTLASLGLNLSWEIDVWGRLRRLTEAARAEFLGQEETRRAVVTTLVADVAGAYFSLRELDLELTISRRTLETRRQGLRLTTARRDRGVESALAVRQAEDLFYSAMATIAQTERQIAQAENLISLLVGRNPGEVARGRGIYEQQLPPSVPAGLPSALLERRPDIRAAEQNLTAANARIGAARAAYFPQISLTGSLGFQSRELGDLFNGTSGVWSFVPGLLAPIFNAGRIRSGVQFAEAFREETLAQYERSIQAAFREVSDALVSYRKTREQREQQELVVRAREEVRRLAERRWIGGLDSYLQVLDAERALFLGQLQLAQLRRDELLSIVELYRALGGGWDSSNSL